MTTIKRIGKEDEQGLHGKEELSAFIAAAREGLIAGRADTASPEIYISPSGEKQVNRLLDGLSRMDEKKYALKASVVGPITDRNAQKMLGVAFDEAAKGTTVFEDNTPARQKGHPASIGLPWLDAFIRPSGNSGRGA